jgi:peroxiredoxin
MKEVTPTARAGLGSPPADIGVPPGDRAPDASLHDVDGRPVTLSSLYADGPVLLIFYRGGWCPYCNAQIHGLTRAYPEFRERGVTPVAVSVDQPEEGATTKARYTIPFPVLSDPDLAAHRAFRVMHEAGDEEVARLKGFGMDLERASGRDHHVIAIPSMFLVDASGVVRGAHADPDYKVRPSNEQLLQVIDGLEL